MEGKQVGTRTEGELVQGDPRVSFPIQILGRNEDVQRNIYC